MDSKAIRYQNARYLVELAGGVSSLAEKIGKTQSQVSQFAGENPVKGIGNKIARELEQAFHKPHGWLDAVHTPLTPAADGDEDRPVELSRLIEHLDSLNSANKLPPEVIAMLRQTLNTIEKVQDKQTEIVAGEAPAIDKRSA